MPLADPVRERLAAWLDHRAYSPSADEVLTVILLPADTDPADPPDGDWWGTNAWRSNGGDRRIYEQEQERWSE